MSTHANSRFSKYKINGQRGHEIAKLCKSEAVVIDSIDMREILRFQFYIDMFTLRYHKQTFAASA